MPLTRAERAEGQKRVCLHMHRVLVAIVLIQRLYHVVVQIGVYASLAVEVAVVEFCTAPEFGQSIFA